MDGGTVANVDNGVYLKEDSAIMNGGEISGNTGGGVYVEGSSTTFTMADGTSYYSGAAGISPRTTRLSMCRRIRRTAALSCT